MSSLIETENEDSARRERTIRSLTEGAGAPIEHVRRLFADEFCRLGKDAKVRRFLHALTRSNVRAMLRLARAGDVAARVELTQK